VHLAIFVLGDFMKIHSLAAVSAAVLLGSQAMASPGNPTLNFEKINATIAEASQPMVATSTRLSQFSFAFDPAQTSVEEDRYAMRIKMSGNAPWSEAGFRSESLLVFDHDSAANGMIKLQVQSGIETDVLALMRRAAAKMEGCPNAEELTGIMHVAKLQDCKIMTRLMTLSTMDELHALMLEHIQDNLSAFSEYRSAIQHAHDTSTNKALRHSLQRQLLEVDQLIESFRGASVTRSAEGVLVTMKDFTLFGLLEIKTASVAFTEQRLVMAGELHTKLGSKLYTLAKPEIVEVLQGLEAGEEYAKKLMKLETRFWLRLADQKLMKLELE
jgi:hypothetical protein